MTHIINITKPCLIENMIIPKGSKVIVERVQLFYTKAEDIKSEIQRYGFDVLKSSYSSTSFGDSYYIDIQKNDVTASFRISDHTVGYNRFGDYAGLYSFDDSVDTIIDRMRGDFKKETIRSKKVDKATQDRKLDTAANIERVALMLVNGEISKNMLLRKSKIEIADATGWYDTKDYANQIIQKARELKY